MKIEAELKTLAAQLRCPKGKDGIKLGQMMNISNLPVILHGINSLHIEPQNNILELGYGNGGLLGYILSLARDIHYTGLEISSTMHQEAVSQNRPYIDANMANYLTYDGINLPFANDTFDKVLTVNTIYFWTSPLALLENICRILKIGGDFCLTFCDKAFMQTLPFIGYDFQLYDVAEVRTLAINFPLKLIHENHQTDKCISKIGALVEREFASLVFRKKA